jgi:hypothetical protein
MSRNRFLILLGGCLLAASAAWADDVGFVECSSHPDGTQVFSKPRKSPEVVASVPCGERFTILVYGFVFSRVQTGDGKIGYVYSNLIAVDRAAAPVQKPASAQMVAASEKVPIRTAPAEQPAPPPAAKPQPTPAQSVVAAASVSPSPASPAPASSASAPAASAANLPEITVSATPPAPAAAPASGSLLPTPNVPETTVTPVPAQPAAAPVPSPASSAPVSPAATSNVSEPAPPAAQPEPSAAAQPQPEPAQPSATPAIRPVESHATWERPLPGGRTTTPRVEVFGGYSFARLNGGAGTYTNLNGAMGSFGWNFKPWLQIVGDSSYNFVTISGTKNILYGNHFGARYFYRKHSRWGITPFAEALVGGSRADTTVTGVGGYTTSVNCLSYKVGGGFDIHPSRHWEIRVLDFDYYRTSFGTNVHQNNYWASTGIVLRLFGGAE